MVIFGWGHQWVKDFGDVAFYQCSNCHNAASWHLVRVNRWFSLFFIPVFPYVWDYWILCPICGMGGKIDGEEKDRLLAHQPLHLAEVAKLQLGEVPK